jgi:hypothetical protein
MAIQDRIKLWREDAAVLRRRGARRAAITRATVSMTFQASP